MLTVLPQPAATRLKTRDIRLLCQTRDQLRHIAPNSDYFGIVHGLRREYVTQIGHIRYVSDMLGHFAGVPAGQCVAFYDDHDNQESIAGGGNNERRVLDFLLLLVQQFGDLPNRIEVQDNGKTITFNL